MKSYKNYYVLDTLTESVVGSFMAINDEMAEKVMDESIKKSDKLQQINNYLLLYRDDNVLIEIQETFDEVKVSCVPINWHPFLSFEVSKDE